MAKNPKASPNDSEVEECNIGSVENPKMIKLSKSLSQEDKEKCINLMKEFFNVFAWNYDDLKVYGTSII